MNRPPADVESNSVDGRILASLERISQAFRVLLWNEGKNLGLNPVQIQVLIFLLNHSEEKRKVSYLAEEFNITKATVSDTVKALEQKELITKEYEQHDTRSYIIHLSKKGKQLAEQTSRFAKEIQTPIEKLSGDDKETMLVSLMGIIEHLNKTGVITIQRMCATCAHYRKNYKGQQHFCALINKQLANTELRIDCAEHQQRK